MIYKVHSNTHWKVITWCCLRTGQEARGNEAPGIDPPIIQIFPRDTAAWIHNYPMEWSDDPLWDFQEVLCSARHRRFAECWLGVAETPSRRRITGDPVQRQLTLTLHKQHWTVMSNILPQCPSFQKHSNTGPFTANAADRIYRKKNEYVAISLAYNTAVFSHVFFCFFFKV